MLAHGCSCITVKGVLCFHGNVFGFYSDGTLNGSVYLHFGLLAPLLLLYLTWFQKTKEATKVIYLVIIEQCILARFLFRV